MKRSSDCFCPTTMQRGKSVTSLLFLFRLSPFLNSWCRATQATPRRSRDADNSAEGGNSRRQFSERDQVTLGSLYASYSAWRWASKGRHVSDMVSQILACWTTKSKRLTLHRTQSYEDDSERFFSMKNSGRGQAKL